MEYLFFGRLVQSDRESLTVWLTFGLMQNRPYKRHYLLFALIAEGAFVLIALEFGWLFGDCLKKSSV